MSQSEAPANSGERFKALVRACLLEMAPEILSGHHHTIRAKVKSAPPLAGGTADSATPLYTVMVQPLTLDGTEDPAAPVVEAVLQPIWVGAGGGLYRLPPVGAIVRLEYDYASPTMPVVVGVLPDGQTLPPAEAEELVIHNGPVVFRFKADGRLIIQGSSLLLGGETAADGVPKGLSLIQWLTSHTHGNGNNGTPTTGPTVPPDAATLLSQIVKVM